MIGHFAFCTLQFSFFNWSESTTSVSSKTTKIKRGWVGFCVHQRLSAAKKRGGRENSRLTIFTFLTIMR